MQASSLRENFIIVRRTIKLSETCLLEYISIAKRENRLHKLWVKEKHET